MSEQPPNPLICEIVHWQEVTLLRYQQFLESATALDLITARRHIQIYSKLLTANLEFYGERLDEYQDLGGDSIQLVRADHLILRRTLDLVSKAIDELEEIAHSNPASLRTGLVERLDVLVRMRNILINHQDRQRGLLIPLFENEADPEKSQKLADGLTEAMQRARAN